MWEVCVERDGMSLCQGWDGFGKIVSDDRFSGSSYNSRRVLVSNCKFMVINSDTQEIVHTECHDSCVIGVRKFGPKEIFKSEILLLQYLYNGTLTVQVEAELSFLQENERCAANVIQNKNPQNNNPYKDMYRLYQADELVDAIIKCNEMEFKVHKVVLASQSPVFQAMFEANMKEQSDVVEVSGITSAAMSDLITYIYTGTAPNIKTLANELLDAADKYQINRLFKMCECQLQDQMSMNDAVNTLIQADLYGRAGLKKACFEFIRHNRAKVFEASEWDIIKDQNTALYLEALEYVLCPKN